MNNQHKILATINMVLFLGGYRMVSNMGAILGLLNSYMTIAVLVVLVAIPIFWGAILSWKFYQRKAESGLPKAGWAEKILAVFPFLNLISILLFILVVVLYR